MNEYIKFDISNGLTYFRCAVINALFALDNYDLKKYTLEAISIGFLLDILKECGWKEESKDLHLQNYKFEYISPKTQKEIIISGNIFEPIINLCVESV